MRVLSSLPLVLTLFFPVIAGAADPPAGSSTDRQAEALALKEAAAVSLNAGKAAEAAGQYRQALGIAREIADRDLEARLLNNLGLALQASEGAGKAREAFDASLARAKADGNQAVEALALANLADLDRAGGDARAALPRLERAAEIARKLGPPPVAARVLVTLAQVYDGFGDQKESVKLWAEAVSPAHATGSLVGESSVLLGLGLELAKAGQADRAVTAFRQAQAVAREAGDGETEAASLQGLAVAYEQLADSVGEAAAARSLLEAAAKPGQENLRAAGERHLKNARARGEIEDETAHRRREIAAALQRNDFAAAARLSLDLGLTLLGQDKLAEGAAALDQSLVLAGRAQERVEQTLALNALLRLQGSEAAAREPRVFEPLTHMVQAAHDLGLLQVEAALLVQTGLTALENHTPREAVAPLEQGLALAEELSLVEPALTALDGLVFAHTLLQDRAAAVRLTERLLAEATKAKEDLWIGTALKELGAQDLEQGDTVRAIDRLKDSVAAFGHVTSPGADLQRTNTLHELAVARFQIGDSTGALEAAVEAAGIARRAGDRKGETLALQLQAGILFSQGDGEKAEKLLAEAQSLGHSLGDRTLETQARISLALVAWDRAPRRAIEHLEKALALGREPASSPAIAALDRQMEWILLGLLARAHANLDELGPARDLANAALAAAADGTGVDRALALDHRAYVHFRAGRLPQAEADARGAVDLFEAEEAKLGKAELAKAGSLDQKSSLDQMLLRTLIGQGKTGEALAVAERRRARAFVEALGGGSATTPSPEALARIARDFGVTVVEYSIFHDPTQYLLPGSAEGLQPDLEEDLAIWVVGPEGGMAFRQVDLRRLRGQGGEALGQRIRFLLQRIESTAGLQGEGDAELRPLLRDLHGVLIAPIADLLPADPEAPVVIVPQGPLFLVPFGALVDPSGRFLIEQHTLVTAPSIEALAGLRRPGSPESWRGAGALVVGDPRTSPRAGKLKPLAFAEEEAKAVAAGLGAEALLGERATEAAVVQALPRAHLVHFASHGLPQGGGNRLLPGALALTPSAGGEDGLLTAGEIRALPLTADLVVLSACDSGRGRISGDGVIGLTRSFLAAGAAAVIMSQWRIDDEATSALMIDFYRRLKGSADPPRALRSAMLAAIQRGDSLRSWGAFTYVGAPRRRHD